MPSAKYLPGIAIGLSGTSLLALKPMFMRYMSSDEADMLRGFDAASVSPLRQLRYAVWYDLLYRPERISNAPYLYEKYW